MAPASEVDYELAKAENLDVHLKGLQHALAMANAEIKTLLEEKEEWQNWEYDEDQGGAREMMNNRTKILRQRRNTKMRLRLMLTTSMTKMSKHCSNFCQIYGEVEGRRRAQGKRG